MSYNNYYITGFYPNSGYYNHELPLNISLVNNGRFINCKCGRQYYHNNLSYNCPHYQHYCPFCGLYYKYSIFN